MPANAELDALRTIAIVIPSHAKHVHFVAEQLNSWQRFCTDAHALTFAIVLGTGRERRTFAAALRPSPLRWTLLDYRDLVAAAGEEISGHARLLTAKHVLQSIKKLYGCLALLEAHAWCFATDSETLLIKCMSMRATLAAYAERRTVLHNTAYAPARFGRHAHQFGLWACASSHDRVMLGDEPQGYGWLLETYAWLWERRAVRAFYRTLRSRNTTPAALWERGYFSRGLRMGGSEDSENEGGALVCGAKLFIEHTLNRYLALGRSRSRASGSGSSSSSSSLLGREYTFADTASVASAVGLPSRTRIAVVDGACSIGECLAAALPDWTDPQVDAMASLWARHSIPTLTPRTKHEPRVAVDRATGRRFNGSVRSCASRPAECSLAFPPINTSRPLSRAERRFLERSGVSILTSGDGGPMHEHARRANRQPGPPCASHVGVALRPGLSVGRGGSASLLAIEQRKAQWRVRDAIFSRSTGPIG